MLHAYEIAFNKLKIVIFINKLNLVSHNLDNKLEKICLHFLWLKPFNIKMCIMLVEQKHRSEISRAKSSILSIEYVDVTCLNRWSYGPRILGRRFSQAHAIISPCRYGATVSHYKIKYSDWSSDSGQMKVLHARRSWNTSPFLSFSAFFSFFFSLFLSFFLVIYLSFSSFDDTFRWYIFSRVKDKTSKRMKHRQKKTKKRQTKEEKQRKSG